MKDELLDIVRREITNNTSLDDIREKLIQQGYLEKDIDKAMNSYTAEEGGKVADKKLAKTFATKEIFDRIGYGFVPHQFVNILFYLTGASFFWLGMLNGAKSILSIILSSAFQEYSKLKQVSKGVVSKSGYLFGFSFLLMPLAVIMKSTVLFAVLLLLGGIGVVTHGDLYNQMVKKQLKKEKMSKFLASIATYGVMITAVSMLISGWLMDKFPVMGRKVEFMGTVFPMYGHLISFEITAIAFILSGYFLSKVEWKEDKKKVTGFLGNYLRNVRVYLGTFVRNKYLFFLILTTVLMGLAQVLGNSYFGVFIFKRFRDVAFGGFLNVAIIYFIAVMASFLGPWFTKRVHKHTGLAPTLVFGTLLVALMPITLAYNPNIMAVGIANALSVVGAAILGVGQGMLTKKLLREDEARVYFSTVSIAAVIPFLILIPLGSYFAQTQGLVALFKIIGFGLAAVVAPLYIILVGISSKRSL